MKKVGLAVVAIVLCSCVAQAQEPTREQNKAEKIQKALNYSRALMWHIQLTCKTEDCAKVSEEGLAMFKDLQTKHSKGELQVGSDDWKAWKAHIQKSVETTRKGLMVPRSEDISASLAGKARVIPITTPTREQRCSTCDKVFAAGSAICGIWALYNPALGAFCEAYTIFGYMDCVETWCDL